MSNCVSGTPPTRLRRNSRLRSGRQYLNAVVRADDGLVRKVEEQAVLDHAGDQLEIIGQPGRIMDGGAFRVVDQIAAIRPNQPPLG